MASRLQWLSTDSVAWFTELSKLNVIPSLPDLNLPGWECLTLEHLNLFTASHLFAILSSAQMRNKLCIEPFPDPTKSTEIQLRNEVVPFITIFSPTFHDHLQLPSFKPYLPHLARYQRQKQIRLSTQIVVPLDGHEASFESKQRDHFIQIWGHAGIDKEPTDISTNVLAYLSATKYKKFNSYPLYEFPMDIQPHRFAYHLTALRRVRLSARVNEELVHSIGVSFFTQDKTSNARDPKALPVYRSRFREDHLDIAHHIPPNSYARVRIVGIRPTITYKTGLGVDVVPRFHNLPQSTFISPHLALPDSKLVNEITNEWMVFPFSVPNAPDTVFEPRKSSLFWSFLSSPPTLEQRQQANQDPNSNKFTLEDKDFKLIHVQPEMYPHSEWKSKLLKSGNRGVPIVEPIKLPRFILDDAIASKEMRFELAYKLQPRDIRPKEKYDDPPFRACALVEIVRILSLEEITKKVLDKTPVDIPRILTTGPNALQFHPGNPTLPSAPATSTHSPAGTDHLSTLPQNFLIAAPTKCPMCQKDEGLSRCSACKEIYYCSRECQGKHWPQHRDYCRQRRFEKEQEEAQKRNIEQYQTEGIELIAGDSAQRISLECPLSSVRCKIPVRGLHCRHKRCFDLKAWLDQSIGLQHTKNNCCPLCADPLLLDDLRVSQRVRTAVETLDPKILDVELDAKTDLYKPYYRDGQLLSSSAIDDSDAGSDGESPWDKVAKRQKIELPTPAAANELVQLPAPSTSSTHVSNTIDDAIELD